MNKIYKLKIREWKLKKILYQYCRKIFDLGISRDYENNDKILLGPIFSASSYTAVVFEYGVCKWNLL